MNKWQFRMKSRLERLQDRLQVLDKEVSRFASGSQNHQRAMIQRHRVLAEIEKEKKEAT